MLMVPIVAHSAVETQALYHSNPHEDAAVCNSMLFSLPRSTVHSVPLSFLGYSFSLVFHFDVPQDALDFVLEICFVSNRVNREILTNTKSIFPCHVD